MRERRVIEQGVIDAALYYVVPPPPLNRRREAGAS